MSLEHNEALERAGELEGAPEEQAAEMHLAVLINPPAQYPFPTAQIFGPFGSREAAERWAERAMEQGAPTALWSIQSPRLPPLEEGESSSDEAGATDPPGSRR